MRNANTWLRSVVGLGAVLLVAGPGLVMAVVNPSYTPRSLVVNGPAIVPLNGTAGPYTAIVTYTNGVTEVLTSPDVTFSGSNSRITITGGNTAQGVSTGISAVKGTFTQQNVLVSGSRIVRVQ